MVDPLVALLLTALVAALLVALFRPWGGIYWQWRSGRLATGRVLLEDALKHLHDCEYRQVPATLHSLSGALRLSGARAAELLARLETLELVCSEGGRYCLTPDGRGEALRVIRVHRLLEHYLSEETGLGALDWHARAEHLEHRTSVAEATALAARLGDPRYDPHGDPIPTSSGEIAPRRGQPLSDLPVGELAEIVHVEDEPDAVYAQLVAAALHPGMRVRVSEASPDRVRFEVEGQEHVLAPVLADNLSVVPVAAEQVEGPFEDLTALEMGEKGRVIGISPACRGPERRRLLDLGLVPGTVVEAQMSSPRGDPTAYRIRGAVIALRREQAGLIRIDRGEAGDSP